MRDLVLLAALGLVFVLTARAPFVGLLAWIWVSLMNPHQEVYGFLNGAPLNMVIAAATAASWLASRERKLPSANAFIVLLAAFGAWAAISTMFALDPAHAAPLRDRTLKTIVLVVVVVMLANTRVRLQAVVWAVVISIGYYGVKGGGFTLLTGGSQKVYGPANSMIADNNCLGLALVMILPLALYLRMTSARAIVRWGLLGFMGLTFVAILGTYSRGALIGLVACLAVGGLRSRYGLVLALVGALGAAAAPSLMPASWSARMSTIRSYNDDDSFEGRVQAWRTSANIAAARPLTGGGFSAVEESWIAEAYASPGSSPHGRAAHSVYFQVLGDTGYVGLGLYLSAIAVALMNTMRVLALTKGDPGLRWAGQLARMLQVSLAAFLTDGAVLSMAYYDGVLLVFGLTAALLATVKRPAPALAAEPGGSAAWRSDQRRRSPQPARAALPLAGQTRTGLG